MKLLSIDVETTGLDPNTCSVLEIGCVIFDPQPVIQGGTEKARRWTTFECILSHTRIQGEPYALGMNADLINEIAGRKKTHVPIYNVTRAITKLRNFLCANSVDTGEKYTIVGKNYDAFDAKFLDKIPGWKQNILPLCERRSLDLGSLCFCPEDGKVPNLQQCLEKLGIRDSVSHRALDDAMQVATGVSRFFAE